MVLTKVVEGPRALRAKGFRPTLAILSTMVITYPLFVMPCGNGFQRSTPTDHQLGFIRLELLLQNWSISFTW